MKHLSDCPACRELTGEVASLRKTLMAESHHQPAPSEQTLSRIRKAAKRPSFTADKWIIAHPWSTALAAAASIALFLSLLRFAPPPSASPPVTLGQEAHAIEIIPLIAMITGTESLPLNLEDDDAGLTVLANELLRLQDTSSESAGDGMESTILPEDYQPTTLLWHSTLGLRSERYG